MDAHRVLDPVYLCQGSMQGMQLGYRGNRAAQSTDARPTAGEATDAEVAPPAGTQTKVRANKSLQTMRGYVAKIRVIRSSGWRGVISSIVRARLS